MGLTHQQNLAGYIIEVERKFLLTSTISKLIVNKSYSFRLEPLSGKIQSVTELVPERHFTSRSRRRSGSNSSRTSNQDSDKEQEDSSAMEVERANERLRDNESSSNKRQSEEGHSEAGKV